MLDTASFTRYMPKHAVLAYDTQRGKQGRLVVEEHDQLADNERHPVTGKPVAKIIHSFGRTDRAATVSSLVRLCRSIALGLQPGCCRSLQPRARPTYSRGTALGGLKIDSDRHPGNGAGHRRARGRLVLRRVTLVDIAKTARSPAVSQRSCLR